MTGAVGASAPERFRRRRAAILVGLALVLGALAAADVSGREAELRRQIGSPVPVLVARTALAAGAPLAPRALAVRQVPARYAPAGAFGSAREVAGLRAAVAIPAGTDLDAALIDDGSTDAGAAGPPLRAGERDAQVVAVGAPEAVAPGVRVDVLVTREGSAGGGSTTLALEDVEVIGAAPAAASGEGPGNGLPRLALALRVSVRQAVYLAAAQSFAREVRVLARAPGDRRRGTQGMRVSGRL
ncbi:MAG: pilus assembly protein CpaB [Solirubrobacteraceae bacterium]|nr:pilus assembly protein CpaB [Solirubrobacteraceae bacterium]